LICLVSAAVLALVLYESLPRPNSAATTYWVEYVLTKNGNHTQIQATYSNGVVTTNQIMWLDFDNKTAVYKYFRCTPSMTGCTADGCPFTVLDDTATEYRVKIACPPGA
jgi:hypothetical protein